MSDVCCEKVAFFVTNIEEFYGCCLFMQKLRIKRPIKTAYPRGTAKEGHQDTH